MSTEPPLRSAVVFGARNLGRAVIERLTAAGWGVVGVARSQATLDRVALAGALALDEDEVGAGAQKVVPGLVCPFEKAGAGGQKSLIPGQYAPGVAIRQVVSKFLKDRMLCSLPALAGSGPTVEELPCRQL